MYALESVDAFDLEFDTSPQISSSSQSANDKIAVVQVPTCLSTVNLVGKCEVFIQLHPHRRKSFSSCLIINVIMFVTQVIIIMMPNLYMYQHTHGYMKTFAYYTQYDYTYLGSMR